MRISFHPNSWETSWVQSQTPLSDQSSAPAQALRIRRECHIPITARIFFRYYSFDNTFNRTAIPKLISPTVDTPLGNRTPANFAYDLAPVKRHRPVFPTTPKPRRPLRTSSKEVRIAAIDALKAFLQTPRIRYLPMRVSGNLFESCQMMTHSV